MEGLLRSLLLFLLANINFIVRGISHDFSSFNGLSEVSSFTRFHINTLPNIPKLQNGHKQFHFYNLDAEGRLQKQWMSLQEVQNIILAYSLSRHSVRDYLQSPTSSFSGEGYTAYDADKASSSVDDVLANVQKVMSKEMNPFLQEDALISSVKTPVTNLDWKRPTIAPINNVEIVPNNSPSPLLTYIMEEQMSSLQTNNPWGITTMIPTTTLIQQHNSVTDIGETVPTTDQSLTESTIDQENAFDNEYFLSGLNKKVMQRVTTMSPVTESVEQTTENISGPETTQTSIYLPTSNSPLDLDMSHLNELFINEEISEKSTVIPVNKDTSLSTQDETIPNNTTETSTDALVLAQTPMGITDVNATKEEAFVHLDNNTQTILHNDSLLLITTTELPMVNNKTTLSPNTDYIESTVEPIILNQNIDTSYNDYEDEDGLAKTLIPENFLQANALKNQEVDNETTIESTLAPYPAISLLDILSNSSDFVHLLGKSPHADAFNTKYSGLQTNVLTPVQIAPLPQDNIKNLAKIPSSEHYEEYVIDEAPIYLEDLEEIEYDFDDLPKREKPIDSKPSAPMDFPSPETASSFHKPPQVSGSPETPSDAIDFHQFLPTYNPALAKEENPLRTTPLGNQGLYITAINTDPEIRAYVDIMNDISFKVYKEAIKIHRRQNLVMSPLNLASTLSMLFLGARNGSALALSDFLKIDKFIRFNPHQVLKNITTSAHELNDIGHESAFVNDLYIENSWSDLNPMDIFVRILNLFYQAAVEVVPPDNIGPVSRDRANEKIRRLTKGAVESFLKPDARFHVHGPLSAVSSAYFQANWDAEFTRSDLIDMNFIRFPSAERRLIRTVGISKEMRLNAGYSKEMDATITEIPLLSNNHDISLLLVMPGRQKNFIANGLSELEHSLTSERWNRLLKAVIPHTLDFKMPIFSHRNYLNLSGILDRVGLQQLFTDSADFSGINGAKNLFLGDVVQLTEFHSCKLDPKIFNLSTLDNPLKSRSTDLMKEGSPVESSRLKQDSEKQQSSRRGKKDSGAGIKKLEVKSRDNSKNWGSEGKSDRIRRPKTLAYDRAFFYALRHNPTGLILYIGRYLDPETF